MPKLTSFILTLVFLLATTVGQDQLASQLWRCGSHLCRSFQADLSNQTINRSNASVDNSNTTREADRSELKQTVNRVVKCPLGQIQCSPEPNPEARTNATCFNNTSCTQVMVSNYANSTQQCHKGFTCRRTKLCLPKPWVGDGIVDCGFDPVSGERDRSDEEKVPTSDGGRRRAPCSGWKCGRCLGDLNRTATMCDGVTECDDASDELPCPTVTSPVQNFTCRDGTAIEIEKRFDGRPDCAGPIPADECLISRAGATLSFSSHEEMIGLVYLRVFLWVVSVVTLFGNFTVCYYTVRKLMGCRHRKSVFFYNRLLIGNLAVSDSLMGVSLLIVLVKSLHFSGEYCRHDMEWRSSPLCSCAGAIGSVSSQTSVNIVVMMTFLRLRSTLQPFRTHVITPRAFGILVAVCWLSSIATALYPLLAFVEEVQIRPSPFFPHSLVNRTSLRRYVDATLRVLTSPDTSSQWYEVPDVIASKDPRRDVQVIRYFGYYSMSAICFPDYFIPSHEQNVMRWSVCFYNFSVLAFVAVCYYFIYTRATTKNKQQRHQAVENERMRVRITMVIVTDVMMLIPIIVLVVINLTTSNLLDPSRCSLGSIFLLPISSFVNPFLYGRLDHQALRQSLARALCIRRPPLDRKRHSQPTVIEMNAI